ncbi:MAG TPA: response regulator [Gemmatimonadales bacterium]|nr:response regulator [Gemmatimonadales bacterium]
MPERTGMARESARRFLVAVVDDDESVRESLPELLRESGYAAHAFASAQELLDSGELIGIGCLILDITMPGMSGPELHDELRRRGQAVPVVFITAVGDKAVRPRLLAEGAVDCLFKPFSETALLAAIRAAQRVP